MGSMNLENKTTALDDDAAIYQHTEATETAKSLRQKLSEMTFKEKVRYLLDYYGLKALIVLAVLVFLGYTLWAMLPQRSRSFPSDTPTALRTYKTAPRSPHSSSQTTWIF